MSDNTTIASPTVPGDTLSTEDISGVKVPRSKLILGAHGVDGGNVATGNPLPVTIISGGSNAAASATGAAVPASADYQGVTVAGNLTGVTGKTAGGSTGQCTDLNSVGGTALALGQQLAAASVPVVLTAAQITTLTPPATVAVSNFPATQPVSASSLPLPTGASTAAKQPALGTAGSASTDVISVQGIASMTALKVDGSAVTQPVSASSLPLPTGASTAAKQPALGTAGSPSADVITVQGTASGTALKVDASATTQPVSGTVTAQQATGSNLHTVTDAATAGGYSMFHLVSAATTNATSVKGSAGQVGGLQLTNGNANARFVKLYDTASAPTAGSGTPKKTICVPGGTTAQPTIVIVHQPVGLAFASGIGITITGALADNDTTVVTAGDMLCEIDYK